MMRPKSKVLGKVTGSVQVFEERGGILVPIFGSKNSVTDASEEIIRGLLGRDPENYMLDYIAIGSGGDCTVAFPHSDTGARVGPDPIETEIRVLVESIPIQAQREVGTSVILSAIAKINQAISNDVNELALLARNGLMFAHFVTAALVPLGPAEKKPKTDINWILEWTIDYTNA